MLCSFYPAQTNKPTDHARYRMEKAQPVTRGISMEIHKEMVAHLSNENREEGEANMALLVVQERPNQAAIDAAVAAVASVAAKAE